MNQQCAAVLLGLELRERAEQVVGLEGLVAGDQPAESREEGGAVGPLRRERVGNLGAVGVVAGVELDPVLGRFGTEAEDDGARSVSLDLAQDQIGGAEQRVDRIAVAPLDRVGKGKERAVEQRRGVDCE